MKRWIGLSLLVFTVFATGCVDRYRYRDDWRYHYYDHDHGRYDYYRR
jgi:hypothetical protein